MVSRTVGHYSAAIPRPFKSFLNPLKMVRNLWSHRGLIRQLAQREIQGRYRATRLGLLWAVLTPLFMLTIYTFALSVVLGAKWKVEDGGGHFEFAVYLFCGMLVFNLFAEVVTRAPQLVVSNPNYVKKVVFPLEVLTLSALLSALFTMLIGFVVWLIFFGLLRWAAPPPTILLLPLVMLPVCLVALGIAWVLAALAVFVQDIGHAVTPVVQALFFATPVFYGIKVVKPPFRLVLELNPLSYALEAARGVMIDGQMLNWAWWSAALLAGVLAALAGYAFFMKSKRAFADVI